MPTILKQAGLRCYFYSNEGDEPPHIHVDDGDKSAKFWLDPVGLARNHGFPAHELSRILQIIRVNQSDFRKAWHEHFGA